MGDKVAESMRKEEENRSLRREIETVKRDRESEA